MLSTEQLSNLEATKVDLQNKQMVLSTAIDVQAVLRILVDKGIITKEEVQQYREEVRQSQKYAVAITYLEQTMREVEHYEKDPQALLREMFQRKMQGK